MQVDQGSRLTKPGLWNYFRVFLLAGAALCAGEAIAQTEQLQRPAAQTGTRHFSIPPSALAPALAAFGEASSLHVLYNAALTRGLRTGGVSGTYTPEQALSRLLSGTQLTYRFTNPTTVTLVSSNTADAPQSYGPAAAGAIELPEISVNARKRGPEDVQRLPESVFVFNAPDIERTLTRGVEGILRLTPNAQFEDRPNGDVVINLRGNGTANNNTDAGIGLYVDGAYNYIQGNNNNIPFFDIEQVNILLGPQGGLYGRNAVGGAINIQTANPTDQNVGRLTGEIGNFGHKRVEAVVNASSPTGNIRLRVAGLHEQRDSFYFNQTVGRRENGLDRQGGRFKLGLTPNDSLDIVLGVERIEQNLPGLALTRGPDPRSLSTYNNIIGSTERTSTRYIADIKWTPADWLTFRSITGYHLPDGRILGDLDTGPSQNATQTDRMFVNSFSAKQFSQEFRFSSPEGATGPVAWLAGVNYFGDRINTRQDNTTLNFANAGRVDSSIIDGSISQYAVFGEATYEILSGLRLTGSLRYSNETKHVIVTNERLNPNGTVVPLGFTDAADTYERLNPAANLAYDWTSNIMTYVKIATAYKSGGVNFAPVPAGVDPRYAPEDVVSYEAGIRTTWFGGRLIMNATVFHQQQDNLQLRTVDFATGINMFQNVGTGETSGVELTFRVQPAPGLDLSATYGYLSAKFDNAPRVSVTLPTGLPGLADVSGNRVPFIPEHTVNFAVTYRKPVSGSVHGFVTAEYYIAHGGYADALNLFPINTKQNANLSIGAEGENFLIKAFIRNAFNDAYFEVMPTFGTAQSAGFPLGMRNPPRTYGVSAAFRW